MDAVAVMSPTLFKPSSIANLVSYLKSVADHIPNTPFFYYDINVLTEVVCKLVIYSLSLPHCICACTSGNSLKEKITLCIAPNLWLIRHYREFIFYKFVAVIVYNSCN